MAIPDYQTIMLPLLKHLGDGKERGTQETLDALALELDLTEEEMKEFLPSGRQTVFTNRVGWAKVYLKKAGLIDTPKRGYYKITERGIKVLQENPTIINNAYLMNFPEFAEFLKTRVISPKSDANKQKEKASVEDGQTPEEHLEYGYEKVRDELAAVLLKNIKDCSPSFFESLVVDLLLKMGYGGSRQDAAKTVGKAGDGGIDGIIKEDRLGLDTIYIQAKRWEGTVGRPEVQKFAGALQGQRAKKGVFITTSDFTGEAVKYVQTIDSKIVLINGEKLANLMIDNDIGVTKVTSYDVKKVDLDFFTSD